MPGGIEPMVLKHDKDLYHGNGLPGITTRLFSLETCTKSLEKDMKDAKEVIVAMRIQWARLYAYCGAATLVAILIGKVIDHVWK